MKCGAADNYAYKKNKRYYFQCDFADFFLVYIFYKQIDFIEKLDIVSLDIKLPEHFNNDFDKDIFINEIKSVNLLMAKSIMLYCKVVVLPSTKTNLIQEVMEKLSNNISSKNL